MNKDLTSKEVIASKGLDITIQSLVANHSILTQTLFRLNIVATDIFRFINPHNDYKDWADVLYKVFRFGYMSNYIGKHVAIADVYSDVLKNLSILNYHDKSLILKLISGEMATSLLLLNGKIQGNITMRALLKILPPMLANEYINNDKEKTSEGIVKLLIYYYDFECPNCLDCNHLIDEWEVAMDELRNID